MRQRLFGLKAMVATIGFIGGAPLCAQSEAPNAPPEVLSAVLGCQQKSDPAERLACYDEAVPRLQQAQAANEVVIADREQIQEAKRGLFGLTLPSLKLFSRGEQDEINEIEGTIASLSQANGGKWLIVLEDGARWQQTDTRFIRPKVGDSIRIRKAAMGSFFANVNGGTAIRVRRSN